MNRRFFRAAAVVLLLCLVLMVVPVLADGGLANSPWPKAGHDNKNTGRSEFLASQDGIIKWNYSFGGTFNQNAAAIGPDGTIYIGNYGRNSVYAINPDGTLKWSYVTGGNISGSPSVGSDGTIYIGNYGDKKVYALNPDGTLKWTYYTVSNGGGGGSSSPLIGSNGLLYYPAGGSARLYALNLKDGTLNWSVYGGSTWAGIFNAVMDSTGMVYVPPYGSGTSGKLLAFNPSGTADWAYTTQSGTTNWTYTISAGTEISIGSDDTIYGITASKGMYAWSPHSKGTVLWTNSSMGAFKSYQGLAIGPDGTLYAGSSGDQKIYALNPNRIQKWTYLTGGAFNLGDTPVVGADGTIYIANDADLKVYALNPDGTLKWSNVTGSQGIYRNLSSSPAIGSDGSLYIGSGDGKLYAYAGVVDYTADQTSGKDTLAVQFTGTSTVSPISWSWDFGDGESSSDQNPSHTYASPGYYTVNLTISNQSYGTNYLRRTNYIKIYSKPVAGFTANITAGDYPLAVNFTDLSTGIPTAWSWDFGDSSTSPLQMANHTYGAAGNYTVNLTVTNPAGTNTSTKTGYITVSTPTTPVASFTANMTGGVPSLAVQFTDTSSHTPTSWSWDFGDGNTSTLQNPNNTYAKVGNYDVSLTVKNTYGQNTVTKTGYITVETPTAPVANFTVSHRVGIASLAVQFNDTSAHYPTSWSWNFGDGTTSTLKNPSHTYPAAVTYTVSLTATNAQGSNTKSVSGYITVLSQQAALSNYHFINIYVANDESVKYDVPDGVYASGGAYTYVPNTYWVMFRNAGGGTNPMHISSASSVTKTSADVTTTTSQSGSFWVTQSGGQTSMAEGVLMIAVNGTIPDDFKVHIRSSGQVFDPGTPGTGNQYMTYVLPPDITYVEGAIDQTFDKNDFIYGPQNWKPASTADYPIYVGEDQTDPVNQFQLMFIDLRAGTFQNETLANNGMMKVEYSFTNLTSFAAFNVYGWYEQCNHGTGIIMTNSGSGYSVIGAAAAPVANFTASTTSGYKLSPIQFTDTSTNAPGSWLWNFGDGNTSTIQNPAHAYSSTGTYTVKLTVTSSKGTDTKTKTGYITVTIPPSPVSMYSASVTSGNPPLAVQFNDTSAYAPFSWLWDFGDGNTSTIQNPLHTYNTTGSYTVNLTVTNAAGSNSNKTAGFISVYNAGTPVAAFTATPVNGIAPFAVQFTDTSTNSPTSWQWIFGDGSTSSVKNPTHTYSLAGTYSVNLTATNSAGSSSLNRTGFVYVTTSTGALPNYTSIYVRAANHNGIQWDANGNGTYYISPLGSGSGLSSIHISTDSSVSAGQVTSSQNQSGTIYATEGTSSYDDEMILLLGVTGTIPNDFSVRIKTSGYTWTPTGSTPSSGSYTYQSSALDQTFTKSDFFYGPQNWKPTAGDANYPLFYGQDMNSSKNQYQLMFIDTCAGVLSDSSLTNQGAVRIDYSFTNLPSTATFNVYGWKTGQGLERTNALTGTGSSGYSVSTMIPTEPPVAGFVANQTKGLAPFNARFKDNSTNIPTSWSWNFGDGSTSTNQNPSHTYSASGTYTVSLTASNSAGSDKATRAGYITVIAPVVTTNTFAVPGVQTKTNGTVQNATISFTNATIEGNVVNVTTGTGTWDHLAITFNETPSAGDTNWTGTVKSVLAVTQPVTVPIASLGNPNVTMSLNLAQLPDATASIANNITSDPDTTALKSFNDAIATDHKQIDTIAYTINFTKTGIQNSATGGIINATITMAINATWVTSNGGISHIVIMHRADDGTATTLTTTYTGPDASGTLFFTAISPTGLSTFILAAVSSVTPPNTGTTSYADYGGGGGGGGGSSWSVASTTAAPTAVATTAVATTAPPAPTQTTKPKVRITTSTTTPVPVAQQGAAGGVATPAPGGGWWKNPYILAAESVAAIVLVSASIVTYLRRRKRRRDPLRWDKK